MEVHRDQLECFGRKLRLKEKLIFRKFGEKVLDFVTKVQTES